VTPAPKRPRGRPRLPSHEVARMRSIRIPDDLWERAVAAADEDGVDLSEWIRERMEEGLR
jgi:predicted HicB family RNase H-like nuclease